MFPSANLLSCVNALAVLHSLLVARHECRLHPGQILRLTYLLTDGNLFCAGDTLLSLLSQ